MKINEEQIIGNIMTIEQELLYLILLELRNKNGVHIDDLRQLKKPLDTTLSPVITCKSNENISIASKAKNKPKTKRTPKKVMK